MGVAAKYEGWRMLSLINRFASSLAGMLGMIIMSVLVIDIIFRYLGSPILGVSQLSVLLMMVMIYLGFSHCEENDEHVRLDMLPALISKRNEKWLSVFVGALALLACLLLSYSVYYDLGQSIRRNEVVEGAVSFPVWPAKLAMLIGAVLFTLQVVVNCFNGIKDIYSGRV